MDPSEPRSPAPPRPLLRWTIVWLVLLAIPLVPFTLLVLVYDQDPFELWVRSTEGRRALAAVVCFALLASDVFLPVPSSVVAIVSGGALGALPGGVLNWVAITLGHAIGFFAARRWGRPLVRRFVGVSALARADVTWTRGATAALILSRPIPVLAEALAMFAGLTGFSPARFLLIAALANLPHSFIYSWAGARVRDLASLNVLLIAGVGVPALGYALFWLWNSRARPRL